MAKPDKFIGWGGPGGYVYQKAYVEFFCSREKLNALVEKCKSLPHVTYIATNKEGNWVSNVNKTDVNAVTWGVFPGKEVIQPTVVDPASFMVWKDEAFEIWTKVWANLYPEGDSSRTILEQVCVNHYSIGLHGFRVTILITISCDCRYKTATIWSAWSTMITSTVTFLLFLLIFKTDRSCTPSSIVLKLLKIKTFGMKFDCVLIFVVMCRSKILLYPIEIISSLMF